MPQFSKKSRHAQEIRTIVKTMKNKIMEFIDITKEDMSMSVLCWNEKEDCVLCQQINIELHYSENVTVTEM